MMEKDKKKDEESINLWSFAKSLNQNYPSSL